MIKEVKLTRFKKYKNKAFQLKPSGITLLIGGNNSGKSTLIHALSIWEFCRIILLHEKGEKAFQQEEVGFGEGFGMSAEEFFPLAVPSLNHLWTNLKIQVPASEKEAWMERFPGYILRISCCWDTADKNDQRLEFGLSLTNDRLFIRVTDSNLQLGDKIPRIVYLPTFAGILPKETKATIAERRAYLGRGMAGSILRNMIYDLYVKDRDEEKQCRGDKPRLSKTDKARYIQQSPLCRLNKNLRETFKTELEIEPFSEDFHTIIRVNERKGEWSENGEFEVYNKQRYSPRDIISQGSGFLQWLSIFCILYGQDLDVLLLDEPDAHLHASLQKKLMQELYAVTERDGKQILLATHSVDMIKAAELHTIFSMDKLSYLTTESARVASLAGIGSEYFPLIEEIARKKKVVFVENDSDAILLGIFADKLDLALPNDVVYWPTTHQHSDRKKIFIELSKVIDGLRSVSLRDRDMDNLGTVDDECEYKGINCEPESKIKFLEWRRKNIESYLLCPSAIAAASNKDVTEIITYFGEMHALQLPESGIICVNTPSAVIMCDGKEIFQEETNGIMKTFNCDKYDVARNMTVNCISEDIKNCITKIIACLV